MRRGTKNCCTFSTARIAVTNSGTFAAKTVACGWVPVLASRNAFAKRSLIGWVASRSSSRVHRSGIKIFYEAIIRSGEPAARIAKTLKGLKTTNSGRDTRGRVALEPLFMNLVRRKRPTGADLEHGNDRLVEIREATRSALRISNRSANRIKYFMENVL